MWPVHISDVQVPLSNIRYGRFVRVNCIMNLNPRSCVHGFFIHAFYSEKPILGHFSGKTETPAQRLKMCWIVVCGLIHTILEGYFALHHKTLAGENAYLAEVCKFLSKISL